MSEPLPRPAGALWGLVSRPTWKERRVRHERHDLLADPVWEGEGVPEGRGRRVVLIPGFLAGPHSLALLEPWLQRCGWDTLRAPVGRNRQAGEVVLDRLEPWLRETVAEGGGPVAVIGHSRGGQEARVLAVRHPDAVALLVTLGAPLRVLYPPHLVVRAPAAALQLAAWARRSRPDLSGHERYEADRIAPFPPSVPFVSVYSRSDGFLDWRLSLDAAAEHVEVDSTHFGLAASVPAFEAIAHALERLDE